MAGQGRIGTMVARRLRALVGHRYAALDPAQRAALAEVTMHVRAMELNLKAFGYELARRMEKALPVPVDTVARHVCLASKCSTQADLESDWVAHWARMLATPVVYHRKLWELAYVLQAIHEHGHMRPQARGLGFGCGREPIASLLAAQGSFVTVSDLDGEDMRAQGWADNAQHAASLEAAFHPHLVDRATFDRMVCHRAVDMNHVPPDLRDYDFCWSTCAFEHLGSIDHGLRFVEASLDTLRPGGLAVHTTEYNVDEAGPTLEQGATVLFQRRHFEALASRLEAAGHQVAPLDFTLGAGPMDHFIDLPPWGHDGQDGLARQFIHSRHLKVAIARHVATCFGVIVRKAT